MDPNVMIVDDDADIRGALGDLFSDRGYTPVLARNGVEALELLARLDPRPCVMLVDLIMPEMDGFELLARRHHDPLLRGMTLLAMSASPQNLDRKEVQLADHVFGKPLDIDGIVQLVDQCCGSARAGLGYLSGGRDSR